MIGAIVPIYQRGDKSESSNYQGITLLLCLGKFFLSILKSFVHDKGMLSSTHFLRGIEPLTSTLSWKFYTWTLQK